MNNIKEKEVLKKLFTLTIDSYNERIFVQRQFDKGTLDVICLMKKTFLDVSCAEKIKEEAIKQGMEFKELKTEITSILRSLGYVPFRKTEYFCKI